MIFGLHDIQNRAEGLYSRQVRRIVFPDVSTYVVPHPNYDSDSGAHDIAIVRLPKPIFLTGRGLSSLYFLMLMLRNGFKFIHWFLGYVQPVYLPSMYSASNSFHGWSLTTVGWGSTVQGTTHFYYAGNTFQILYFFYLLIELMIMNMHR